MKACIFVNHWRTIIIDLAAIFFIGSAPSTILAQETDQNFQIHWFWDRTEDVNNMSWTSVQSWKWASSFLLNPKEFKASWPRYGYEYSDFVSVCDEKPVRNDFQDYDIGSGALAYRNEETDRYISLLFSDDTDSREVEAFVETIDSSDQNLNTTDAAEESDVFRLGRTCDILLDNESVLQDHRDHLIFVTRHPIPGSETNFRLTAMAMPRTNVQTNVHVQ